MSTGSRNGGDVIRGMGGERSGRMRYKITARKKKCHNSMIPSRGLCRPLCRYKMSWQRNMF